VCSSDLNNYGLALAIFGGVMAVAIAAWTAVGPERSKADFLADATASARA